jgi:hypothetical protein
MAEQQPANFDLLVLLFDVVLCRVGDRTPDLVDELV